LDIESLLKSAKNNLKSKNIESYSLDAELLLMHVLDMSRVELVTKSHIAIELDKQQEYFLLVERRLNFEPVQYILNKAEFMGLDFYVDKNVLIPRGDTECLVEEVLLYIEKNNCVNVIDICTGSGCIPISLISLSKSLTQITAVDISPEALSVAKKNATRHNVYDKISFVESDMFESIPLTMKKEVDVIISNPPYIDTREIGLLKENVKNYEPILALDGKEGGLYFYKEIAKKSKDYLKTDGKIFMEIGSEQADLVKDIFLKEGYKDTKVKKDLSGLDRIMVVDR